MTKGEGQKHFKRDDHQHAAHQTEIARHQDHDAMKHGTEQVDKDGHPVDQPPKGPRKGQ